MSSYDQSIAQEELERWIALGRTRPGVIDAAGPVEKDEWVKQHPWIAGVAGWGRLSLNDVILASMAQSNDWGWRFEEQHKRTPWIYDWKTSYYSIANEFCQSLGMQPAYADDHRLRFDFGGPF